MASDDDPRSRDWYRLFEIQEDRRRRKLDVSGLAKEEHRDKAIVWRDVQRAVWRLGQARSWPSKVRTKRRGSLRRVVDATFAVTKECFYYQGFHEVAEVVLHVLGFDKERDAVVICEKFVTHYFFDATRPRLDAVALALRLIVPLIFAIDSQLATTIFAPGLLQGSSDLVREPVWALSWIVTWFAHDLDDLDLILLIWDAILRVGHPAFPLYIAAALVVHLERELSFVDDDEDDRWPMLYSQLSKLPSRATKDDWLLILETATNLFHRVPPDALARSCPSFVPRDLRPSLIDLQTKSLPRSFFFFFDTSPIEVHISWLSKDGHPALEHNSDPPPPPKRDVIQPKRIDKKRKKLAKKTKRKHIPGTTTTPPPRHRRLLRAVRPQGVLGIGLLAAVLGGDFLGFSAYHRTISPVLRFLPLPLLRR